MDSLKGIYINVALHNDIILKLETLQSHFRGQ